MTGSDGISEQPMSSSKWMSLTNKGALLYSWGWSSCCGEGDRLSYGLPRQTYWTRSVSDLNPASIGQIVSIHASDWRRGRHSSAEVQHPTTPGINSDTCWKYLKCKKFMLKVRYYCIALPLFCFPPARPPLILNPVTRLSSPPLFWLSAMTELRLIGSLGFRNLQILPIPTTTPHKVSSVTNLPSLIISGMWFHLRISHHQ